MGSSKKYHRNQKPQAQFRSRTTRSSKGRLLTDPAQNTQLLTEQLRALGLYAAPTLGDGNCLFRALSDQLYGSPSHHMQLRKEICDWIEKHKQRYEPFVEDERGLDVHLKCMRENATYGGHLELSAFAHSTRRNVKVIQPGLVYVIEWNAGGGDPPASDPPEYLDLHTDEALNERDKRRLRRDKKRAEKEKEKEKERRQDDLFDDSDTLGAIYVAYHDWEHFSSIRKLKGPHSGLPYVTELGADPEISSLPSAKAKATFKVKSPLKRRPLVNPPLESELDSAGPSTPSQIPLPNSRSPSRSPSLAPSDLPSLTTTSPSSSGVTPSNSIPIVDTAPFLHSPIVVPRVNRSPKRSFDESSGSSVSDNIAKRTRSSKLSNTSASNTITRSSARRMDDAEEEEEEEEEEEDGVEEEELMDIDVDGSTPGLSAPGSSVESSLSSSDASSPQLASPPPLRVKPMTRRQRKAAGLPKPRTVVVGSGGGGRSVSAGKIVIPGGKYKKSSVGIRRARVVGGDEDDGYEGPEDEGEWKRNGSGRVDVRGFRELKI